LHGRATFEASGLAVALLVTGALDDAVALAEDRFVSALARVPLPHQATGTGPLARLTPREREVLELLATGATNRGIAEALFITEKTASVHVSNLLAKLDVPNRGGAAALARRLVG
jgi:DNA-binding NarL/FixJ family response regulator